ncbi:transglutaminase domain-containing protein [Glaciihabitans sp. UYNi722]|uniref:transglutaminase domain-containing protein n=1 Tax=Glaciihabitans sp. UYNi722 TaxID=3156344 RepID=UPI00339B47C7
MRRRRLPLSFVVVNTAMLWLATAIASAALWPIYQSTQLVVLIAVTMVVGSAIAILGALYRWPSFVMVLVSVVAYLALGVPLAVPASALYGVLPSLQGFTDLVTGTALGWKQLLTITLPVGDYQALLVPAFVLVLATTVVGLSVALRTTWGELGAIAPIVLFLAANILGPASTSWPLQLSLGLLGAVLVWFIWRRWYRRREAIRFLAAQAADATGQPLETTADRGFVGFRTVLGAALIMAIAGGAAVAATIALPPTAGRAVLRSAIEQPFDPRDYPSPLSGFRRYEQPTAASSVMLSVTGLPAGGRIRVATLDTYDGIAYTVGSATVASASGSFTRVPYSFDQSVVRGTQVSLGVTVEGYSGVWLPTIGKFENVDFSGADATALRDGFYYNDTSGTAADVHQLATGDKYSISAVIPRQPDDAQLASLTPGTEEVPRVDVLPVQLSSTLDNWVSGAVGPGAKLVAMIAAMKENGYISHGVSPNEPASRSGHAADRITELLTAQRMIGDQEQYAVTAALMAGQLGFPARVVFGFAPSAASSGGATEVRGSDVSAWIEVDTARYGWVTIDPTPPVRIIPEEQPKDPSTIARPQSPVQPPPEEPKTNNAQTPQDTSQEPPNDPNPILVILLAVLQVLGWVVLGAAILLSPFIAIIIAKVRRRSLRKRAPTPIQRIRGGWQEFEDAALDHGYTPPESSTRSEVATTVGGIQPLVLAAVADRATFSPQPPDAAEADTVWRSVTDLRLSFREGRTRWERIKAAVSLRSLGGYSVKSLFKR